jgi:hypothetical protein
MPVAWPPEPLWHTWLVPVAIEMMKGLRSSKVLLLHNLFKCERQDTWRFKTRDVIC